VTAKAETSNKKSILQRLGASMGNLQGSFSILTQPTREREQLDSDERREVSGEYEHVRFPGTTNQELLPSCPSNVKARSFPAADQELSKTV
jgi:hypothetical protein